MKKEYVWIGGATITGILLWWFVWREPSDAKAAPPPADGVLPAGGYNPYDDPAAFQNTTNDTSTSAPALYTSEPVGPVTPANAPRGGGGLNVNLTFNTSSEAQPAAKVSAADVKVIQDRVKITPTAVKASSTPTHNRSASSSIRDAYVAARNAQEKEEEIHLIGIGDLVWG